MTVADVDEQMMTLNNFLTAAHIDHFNTRELVAFAEENELAKKVAKHADILARSQVQMHGQGKPSAVDVNG